MEKIHYAKNEAEAMVIAKEVLGENSMIDTYQTDRYGSCQCACGESAAIYFTNEYDYFLKIGICERCATLYGGDLAPLT